MKCIRLLLLFGSLFLLTGNYTFAQNKKVSGSLTDQNGTPLVGASIIVNGSNVSAITDKDGKFSISVPSTGKNKLSITYMGYDPVEYNVGQESTINISMNAIVARLGDVVVVGYGTKRKQSLTGAIATVSASDFDKTPTGNVSDMLGGRLAGVSVNSPTGMPGISSNIVIRGRGTWNNVGATYVIDGIIRDQFAMDGLDPNEIESISVLKDAASTAVYGARAANGVILITTKRGRTGKPLISFKSLTGMQTPVYLPEQLNAYDNALLQNDAYISQGYTAGNPIFYSNDELEKFKTNSYDWLDYAWKTPVNNQYNISVSGGSDNIKYFTSLGYYDAKGSFDNISYKRFNFRTNVDAKISKSLSITINADANIRKDHKFYWAGEGGGMQNWYQTLLYMSPEIPPYIDGKPVGNNTPYHPIEVSRNGSYNNKQWSSYNAQINLNYAVPGVDGLKFKYALSYNSIFDYDKTFYKPYTYYKFKTSGGGNHIITNQVDQAQLVGQQAFDFVKQGLNQINTYQMNTFVTYDKKIGNHEIGALFVYEQSEESLNNFSGEGQDLLTNSIDQIFISSSAAGNRTSDGTASETGRKSYLGRFNYGFLNKYFLEGSFRYDGSLLFPANKRWGFFPSVSAAWRISEENFFKNNISSINNLKLRTSYGIVGNDAGIRAFQYQQNFANADGAVFGSGTAGLQPGVYPNTTITWEKSKNYNVGLEIGAFKNRLTFEFDYFMRHTYDILRSRIRTIPGTFGADLPDENYAIIDTKGFETSVGYSQNIGKIELYARANLGYANNKVINIDVAPNTPGYLNPIGNPINTISGYVATGIFRTQADVDKLPADYTIFGQKPVPGMLNYADLHGVTDAPDGKIDGNDFGPISNKVDPRINYGLSLGAKWKGFSVDVFFQGLAGVDKMINWRNNLVLGNNYSFWKDHWSLQNPNAAYPRVYGYGDPNVSVPSTFWLRNAAFVRLKNVNIAYSLPENIIQKAGFKTVSVFLTGTNLLTFDKIKEMDPEVYSISAYPLMKTFTLGLNITL